MRITLTVLILLATGTGFSLGQSKAEATAIKSSENEAPAQKAQQTTEMRKVFMATHPSTATKKVEAGVTQARTQAKYDKKGGIIVPNASKGTRITNQSKTNKITTSQNQMESKSSASGSRPAKIEKDLKAKHNSSARDKHTNDGHRE